jgi:hypothetical protein
MKMQTMRITQGGEALQAQLLTGFCCCACCSASGEEEPGMEELAEQYRRWRDIEIIHDDAEGGCALCAACMHLQLAAAVGVPDTCTVGLLRQWS